MTSSNSKLKELTDEELLEFQTTKFTRQFGLVCLLGSGRIMVCNSLRDPLATVRTIDELHHTLDLLNKRKAYAEARVNKNLTRIEKGRKKKKQIDETEKEIIATIKL